ncbi:3-hydroxyacyl-CoA dehydrogenase family protein [Streptomyces sioyaensis]|uniref:3-hydroxyacyl-CoA dehydrogenase family protein n=1 Tax=Streptomyces sioyaensis TaxID=67364 RepID=UPI0033D55C7B
MRYPSGAREKGRTRTTRAAPSPRGDAEPATRSTAREGATQVCGLPVGRRVLRRLVRPYKEPLYAAPPLLARMVDAGRLGHKSGSGFYSY